MQKDTGCRAKRQKMSSPAPPTTPRPSSRCRSKHQDRRGRSEGIEDRFGCLRVDVTDMPSSTGPTPNGTSRRQRQPAQARAIFIQFDPDVAKVYLCPIRERKEREWLC